MVVLLLFSAYAISPIYISAAMTKRTGPVSCGDDTDDVTLGIVWVNVLLSSILEDEPADGASGNLSAPADDQDRDLILIKKKRAVLRHASLEKHLLRETALAVGEDIAANPVTRVYEVPFDLCHRLADGSHDLHTGISPPVRAA